MSNLEDHEAEQAKITAMCEAGECDHPECHEKEFGFDVKLVAVIRVKATSEEEARGVLAEYAGEMDINGGAWPDGSPILFNASIDGESDLIEIDGDYT